MNIAIAWAVKLATDQKRACRTILVAVVIVIAGRYCERLVARFRLDGFQETYLVISMLVVVLLVAYVRARRQQTSERRQQITLSANLKGPPYAAARPTL